MYASTSVHGAFGIRYLYVRNVYRFISILSIVIAVQFVESSPNLTTDEQT